MKLGAILLLAFGLSMDAVAVAAARGLSVKHIRAQHVALVAGFFGGFQALMPLFGWLLGSHFGKAVAAGIIGSFSSYRRIGGKMLWEAFHQEQAAPLKEADAFGLRVMLLLAIATSIDAFAAGFTLPLMGRAARRVAARDRRHHRGPERARAVRGHRFGAALGSRLDALGGLVLIGLGLKPLLEHLTGS